MCIRDSYFIGRDELLDRLRQQLKGRHRAALSGLGGIGKTQTAIEYAVRHRSDYPNGVFWVDAETVGGLTSGFVEIAKALQLPAAASNDHEDAVKAVLAWSNRADGWLLILDNVEDRSEVRRFVPERDKGEMCIRDRPIRDGRHYRELLDVSLWPDPVRRLVAPWFRRYTRHVLRQ